MKIATKDDYLKLREDLKDFVTICEDNNYLPTKDDYKEAIEFCLLGESSTISELYEKNSTSVINFIHESFKLKLNELGFKGDDEYDNSKDFETATGMVKAGAVGVIGAATVAAAGTGFFIGYLFKKGKVKSMVDKELEAELKKLSGYQKLVQMKRELAKLKEEAYKPITFPHMAQGPELEAAPEKK